MRRHEAVLMKRNLCETEEDTKTRIIFPALQHAGWKSSFIRQEYSLRKDQYRIVPDQNRAVRIAPDSKRNRPDYLLCRSVNCPLAVIEAKRASLSAEAGIDQARRYAEILDIPFAYATAGEKFLELNLVTGDQRTIPMDQFPSPDELWRMWCRARKVPEEKAANLDKALYYTDVQGRTPRYYQMVAINRTVEAVVTGRRKRVLLVMATGTGKTYTVFQILWRLRQAGMTGNVLYLADRNQLVDQTIIGDFAPFKNLLTKIRNGKIDNSHSIYFGLYQQLKKNAAEGDSSEEDPFRQVPRNFFQVVIVDECHRGSAGEDSSWREILEYYSPAVQIGLTATPNDKEGSRNEEYFGAPLYTYSLKQGIEDGFLAPYRVVRVLLDKDRDGWEPEEGERDVNGRLIEKRLYTGKDFDKGLILNGRTRAVAEFVTKYLHHLGRKSKTIVFCTSQDHAARMRDEIRRCNKDIFAENHNYCVRMTADDEEGKDLYSDFTSVNEPYPVVVTTSKLLTTGADTKCVKLIVLDAPIGSMTEFKQIIGRGTRLREDKGKTFFTILDFRGACALFADPAFDGTPGSSEDWREGDPPPGSRRAGKSDSGKEAKEAAETEAGADGIRDLTTVEWEECSTPVYRVDRVEVSVAATSESYLDENGKLVTQKYRDYTRRNILELFGSEAEFLEVWNGAEEKTRILESLEKKGILFEDMRKALGNPDADEFDLILEIAWGRPPMTRELRASRARRSKFLEKYQGPAREVLETLLDIYAREGIAEVSDPEVLRSDAFKHFGSRKKLSLLLGGRKGWDEIVFNLQNALYLPEEGIKPPFNQTEAR